MGMHCAWNASMPDFLDQLWKVLARRLIADLAIGLAADEGQIRDVVGLATGVAAPQDRLRENVVKLEPMLSPAVSQRDGEVRTPVAGLGIAESEEHRLEEGAALAAAFEFLWRNTSRSCQRDGRQNGRPTRT